MLDHAHGSVVLLREPEPHLAVLNWLPHLGLCSVRESEPDAGRLVGLDRHRFGKTDLGTGPRGPVIAGLLANEDTTGSPVHPSWNSTWTVVTRTPYPQACGGYRWSPMRACLRPPTAL
ncbi:MAG: hypothetical protein ABWY23_00750, partial [Mycetocola sp.]